MTFTLEIDREEDGRWIAEVTELPGVMQYGQTQHEAVNHAMSLAFRVLAERLEHGGGTALASDKSFTFEEHHLTA